MKLIMYKSKTDYHHSGISRNSPVFKVLQNKQTAIEIHGISEFRSIDDLMSFLFGGSDVFPQFASYRSTPPPYLKFIKNKKQSQYKVLYSCTDISQLKLNFAEYLI